MAFGDHARTLLQAFADISGITGDSSLRYANPDSHGMFVQATGCLLGALASRQPASAAEWAASLRALSFVAANTHGATQDTAQKQLSAIATKQPQAPGMVERSALIAGLLSAADALGDQALQAAVQPHWQALHSDFDPATGTYRSISTYSTNDVAWLIGALNSLVLTGPTALRPAAAHQLVAFYEATLNQSGMQLSAPPGKDGAMAGAFEKDLPSVVYYHGRNTPPPPMAGGRFGRLTLTAAEVVFQGGSWTVSDSQFESAGGMHLANELNWFGPHLGALLFPHQRLSQPAITSSGAASSSTALTIIAKNTAFNTRSMTVPVGKEVTITLANQDADVPHNIHVSGPNGVDAKTEIFAGKDGGSRELKFTIPATGEYEFACDVHPAQMNGNVVAK